MIVTIYHTFLPNIQADSTYVVILNMGGVISFLLTLNFSSAHPYLFNGCKHLACSVVVDVPP
jgi:hypothetical protein